MTLQNEPKTTTTTFYIIQLDSIIEMLQEELTNDQIQEIRHLIISAENRIQILDNISLKIRSYGDHILGNIVARMICSPIVSAHI